MQTISIKVLAEHTEFLEQVRKEIPDAIIAPVDRITGKQLMITVFLPVTLTAAQIVAPYVVSQQPQGQKRVVICGDVIEAENLSKEELQAALATYIVTNAPTKKATTVVAKKKATPKKKR